MSKKVLHFGLPRSTSIVLIGQTVSCGPGFSVRKHRKNRNDTDREREQSSTYLNPSTRTEGMTLPILIGES